MNKKIICMVIMSIFLLMSFTTVGLTIEKDYKRFNSEDLEKIITVDNGFSKIIIKGFSGNIVIHGLNEEKVERCPANNNKIINNNEGPNNKVKGLIGWYTKHSFQYNDHHYEKYQYWVNSWVKNIGGDYQTWDEEGFWINISTFLIDSNDEEHIIKFYFLQIIPKPSEEPAGWAHGDGIYSTCMRWSSTAHAQVKVVVTTSIPETNFDDNEAYATVSEGVIITGNVTKGSNTKKPVKNGVVEAYRLITDPTAPLFDNRVCYLYSETETNNTGSFLITAPAMKEPERYSIWVSFPVTKNLRINKNLYSDPVGAGETTTLDFVFTKSKITEKSLISLLFQRFLKLQTIFSSSFI
jgi:hypothetical protein